MSTITEFSANMSKGFARPNLFKVSVNKVSPDKQGKYQMSCFQAQIPGHNIATTDKDIGFRSIAYQKIYSDVILGFYVDADLSQLKFWQEWIDSIIDKTTNQHNYYDKYIGRITITQQNRAGHAVATWTLHDAYPKQIDPIQLDYGTNDAVMTCNATITYRHFTVKWHTVAGVTERGEVFYAENVRTDLNKISPMLEIHKEGWKFGRKIMSEEKLMDMYPGWDKMSRSDQQAARKLYGLSTMHGDSESGGALHTVTT
jgi:hypothetical protein